MTLSIGIIPSVNGYGHTRRMISIAKVFESFNISTTFLTPCALSKKSIIPALISEYKLKYKTICVPKYSEGPYAKIQTFHSCDYLGIQKLRSDYDLLIADTVTWASDYHSDVLLFAQQLWEYRSNNKLAIKEANFRLSQIRKIYGIENFTQNYLRNLTNYVEIPLIDYWGLKQFENVSAKNTIVISSSGAENVMESLEIFDKELAVVYGIEKYLATNPKPTAMICRSGLGAISECLSAGIIPVLVSSTDQELLFNSQVAIKNKWAISYEEIRDLDYKSKIHYIKAFKINFKQPAIISNFELASMLIEQELT